MKLVEALEILGRPNGSDRSAFSVALACGFEPVHLRTFLAAELTEMLPTARIDVSVGVFDDLLGNIRRAELSAVDAIAVVIEWSDIDARLGLRRLGGWRTSDVADIVEQASFQLGSLERELVRAAASTRTVCCPPTLPLPPLFPERPQQSGAQELALRGAVADFLARLARHPGIVLGSLQLVERLSPVGGRHDLNAELTAGSPYSLLHTSAIAELLADLIAVPAPKKGLITDLDDTLWAGLVGEIGPSKVSWSLDSHSQRHALYQQLLASLASAGVMIGVASRNDPGVVARALRRQDLLIGERDLFPVQAAWGVKSESIRKILEVWNVSADAVVYVDNSQLELDEVHGAFHDLETIRFPSDDGEGLWPFLEHLRSRFGKDALTTDDGLRRESIRAAAPYRAAISMPGADSDDVLRRANGAIEFRTGSSERALELINKTNQFNLNGSRMTDAALKRALGDGRRLITASYEDRYGPLGTVAALVVSPGAAGLTIDSWVMSCRAFSRRIEHHCLRYLFDEFGVDELTLAYRPTARNGALQEFLRSLLGEIPRDQVRLTLATVDERGPDPVHRVVKPGP